MKKCLIAAILVFCFIPMAFATIVTNLNQSALYYRLLSRNASTDIDAVYYNPAGLVRLKDGWHIGLHNQTIFQEKTVVNDFLLLNNHTFVGEVNVPVYPDFYAVYKKERLAFSFGFGPNAGGGTADFKDGLPSFEQPFSTLPALISSMGLPTTKYSADIAFKGSSVYYGFQLNVSYALSEMVSGGIGIRYIQAVNTYEGSIKNVLINPFHPLVNPTAQLIPASQFFTAIGQPIYAAMVKDKAVDVKQTGSAFTPLVSLNVAPLDTLTLSFKYEFNTALELQNKTTKDDTGMFPDGEKFRYDIPAILSLGASYAVLPKLRAMLSFNYFFDKSANWDGLEDFVDKNSYDLGLGIEYDVTETILVSAGYLMTRVGVSKDYQSDMTHELSSNGFGLGARFRLGQKLDLDLGGLYVDYSDSDKTINYGIFGSTKEKYQRSTLAFAFGLGYHF